jgi:glutamyl-tRNA synthetase
MAKRDADTAEAGKVIRLMELFNIKIESKTKNSVQATYASESYEEVRKTKAQLIHWIPKGEGIPCQVVMPDASVNEGIAESACKKLKPNTVIQFERFGFVRVNETAAKLTAYYAHK